MQIWIIKAIIQKIISFLPFSHQINFWFQKYVTKGVLLTDEYLNDRLLHVKNHIQNYTKYSNQTIPPITFEIGTGWYPIVPLCFALWGSKEVYTIDIQSFVNENRLKKLFEKIIYYFDYGKLQQFIPVIDSDKILLIKEFLKQNISGSRDLLEKLGVKLMNGDARKLKIENNSIDFITSNNTFEHIYPDDLKLILSEFKRIARNEAVMSHFIDMTDHFAHLDKSISIYHFLKFSDASWKRIDNSIQPQNRLRIFDYRLIYEELKIAINEEVNSAGDVDKLSEIKLPPFLREFPLDKIAVSHSYLVSFVKKK